VNNPENSAHILQLIGISNFEFLDLRSAFDEGGRTSFVIRHWSLGN
jgi:hypothetical protein